MDPASAILITKPKHIVSWYRCPISRENLKNLNERSDFKGIIQTGGHLGLLLLTGTAACLSAGRIFWPWVVGIVFFHGMCWAFLIHRFHELVHGSVFKNKVMNA